MISLRRTPWTFWARATYEFWRVCLFFGPPPLHVWLTCGSFHPPPVKGTSVSFRLGGQFLGCHWQGKRVYPNTYTTEKEKNQKKKKTFSGDRELSSVLVCPASWSMCAETQEVAADALPSAPHGPDTQELHEIRKGIVIVVFPPPSTRKLKTKRSFL